jgi:hypothetical protein
MLKEEKKGFERVLAFGQYVENSKYASEYPENVEVKEVTCFNAVGKRRIKCLKTGVYVLRALA